MTFLAAGTGSTPAVAIVGAPYDATSTFRSGSRFGPEAIRWASQSIESYSPVLGSDLADIALTDLGDLDLTALAPAAAVERVRTAILSLPGTTVPILLGGEHTVSLGAVQALHVRYPNLAVLQLDAHTDLRDEYEGERFSHATVMHRVLEVVGAGALVQVGIRAGTREEFTVARGAARFCGTGVDIPTAVWTWLEGRPVYVTIDIDVVDPSAAPGTGNPEPDGPSAAEVVRLIRRLSLLHAVGIDLVEVSPPYDSSSRTAVLAATLIRETILTTKASSDRSPHGD